MLGMGAEQLLGLLHQVVEAAGHLQGGRRGDHRQDDQHDGDGGLGRRRMEAEGQYGDAEAADQAERDAAAPDADQDRPENEREFEEERPHGELPYRDSGIADAERGARSHVPAFAAARSSTPATDGEGFATQR